MSGLVGEHRAAGDVTDGVDPPDVRAELAVHRDDSLAVLTRRFGDQLFQPRAQIGNPRRGDDR